MQRGRLRRLGGRPAPRAVTGVTLTTNDTTSTSGNYKAGSYDLTPSAATGTVTHTASKTPINTKNPAVSGRWKRAANPNADPDAVEFDPSAEPGGQMNLLRLVADEVGGDRHRHQDEADGEQHLIERTGAV